MTRRPSAYTLFVLSAATVFFLWFAWEGLRAGFSFDDLMSVYRAERLGWAGHLADIAGFFRFSGAYRPTGTLFYLVIFEAFGLNPAAFRVALYAVLAVNLALGYALAAKLTGSREAAAFGIVLFAFHGRLSSFYTNTGFVYDALCFTFYLAAFLYYVRTARPRLWIWCPLFLLCISSKEMAVTLPVLMAAWELLQFERRKRWWLFPTVGAVIVTLFIVGRLVLPPEGLNNNSAYHPAISLSAYLEHAQGFLTEIAYGSKWLSSAKMVTFWAVATVAAVFSRKPGLRIALLWMMVSILPIAFIVQRPLASAYIPMFGLTMLLGDVVWQGTWAVVRRIPAITMPRWGVAGFVMLFTLMALVHRKHGHDWDGFLPEHDMIASATAALRPWQATLAQGAPTLILKSPFPEWQWDAMFLAADLARERIAERAGKPRIPVNLLVIHEQENLHLYFPPGQRMKFDLILSYEHGRIIECDAAAYANLTVAELGKIACTPQERTPASTYGPSGITPTRLPGGN